MRIRRSERNDAFDAFFRARYPRAVGVAHRILGSRTAAEDVAAEAMARAYADWRTVGGLPHRDGWVLRVATNLALDATRRRRVHIETPAGIDPADIATDRVELARAMRSLPRRQREIVALRHLAGFSESEIADVLGLAPGTVKAHGHRGITALRARLGADDRAVGGLRFADAAAEGSVVA